MLDAVTLTGSLVRLQPVGPEHVSYRIPVPLHPDVFVYERIPARGFRRGDDAEGGRSIERVATGQYL